MKLSNHRLPPNAIYACVCWGGGGALRLLLKDAAVNYTLNCPQCPVRSMGVDREREKKNFREKGKILLIHTNTYEYRNVVGYEIDW